MAAADMFLKIDTVSGESKDSKHKGEIDIESFSFGMSNGATMGQGGGGGAGKVSFETLNIMKNADLSSPVLMDACATGKHFPSALLTVRKAGGEQEEFYKIKLTDVLISNVSNTGAAGGAPVETVSLNFSKMQFDYKEQTEKGTLSGAAKFGWDVKANKKV